MRKFLLFFLSVFGLLCSLNAGVKYAWPPVGFEDGAIPPGWTQENVSGSTPWTVEGGAGVSLSNPAGAKTGNYRIAARRPQGQTARFVTRLISPAADVTGMLNPQLCFSHAQVASFNYFDTLRVYYRVNATAQWTLLREFAKPFSAWTSEAIDLEGYLKGTAYQVAFEIADNFGHGVVLDDIYIYQPSTCHEPQFQMIQPSAHSVFMEFLSGGSGEGSLGDFFDLVLSVNSLTDPASAVEGDGVFVRKAMADQSITLDNLETYTTYHAYLRTNCADNASGYTDWVDTTFQTTMLKSLPYVEDFNITTSGSSSDYASLAGWTFGTDIDGANVPFVYVGSSSSYKGRYSVDTTSYLAFAGSQSASSVSVIQAGKHVYAVSPEIDGNLSQCEVSFWGTAYDKVYDGGSTDYAAELMVGVMTNPTDFSTFTPIKKVTVESAYQFKHFFVSLSSYTGSGRYVALRSESDKLNAFFVDNFRVALAATPTPEDVRVFNLTPTGMDISATLFGADSWNLKVSEKYVRDAASLQPTKCLINKTGITGTSYSISDATLAGKIVLVYVQAVKNGVASEWSFPVTVRVPKTAVLPLKYTFDAGTYSSVPLVQLNNEVHYTNTQEAFADVYFPLTDMMNRYPSVLTTAPVHSGGHLKLSGRDNYIVFPYTEHPDSLELQFYLSTGSWSTTYTSYAGNSRVAVGVMTEPYDLSTFVELARFDGSDKAYIKCVADLNAYTGSGHYVAIRAIEPATPHSSLISHNALDDICLRKAPTCKAPTDVRSTTTMTTATLSWNANAMIKWFVSLYSDDKLKNLVENQTVTTPSLTFSDLTSQTTYYYTIRTICGTDTTVAEDSYSFTTKFGIPFREKFTTTSIPTGWSILEGNLSSAWNGVAPQPATGKWTIGTNNRVNIDGNAAYINIFGTGIKHWLVTPELFLEAAPNASLQLSFEAALVAYSAYSDSQRNSGKDDWFAVAISTDGGATWTRANSTVWNNANDSTTDFVLNDLPLTMEKINIDLSRYIGQSIRVAFYAESTESNADNYLFIDNVNIATYDPNCQGIKSLSANALDESSASVAWMVAGNQSVHLDIYAKGNTTPIFSGNVTDNPYSLTGLEGNTQYTVKAHQTCNTEDTLTATFRTHCAPYTPAALGVIDFSDADALSCWMTGIGDTTGVGGTTLTPPSIKTQTGFGKVLYLNKPKNYTSYSSSYNYGNTYYAIMPALDIDSITKYQVTFNAAITTTDTVNIGKLYVGVATDPNDLSSLEIVDTLSVQYAKDSLSMSSYSIGFDRYEGDLFGDYGKYVVFMVAAPANYSNIVLLDNVFVESVSSCRQVTNMEVTDVDVSTATIRWTGQAADYRIVLTTAPCNPDTVSTFVFDQVVHDTHIDLTNLQSSTTYYAYNKAICGVGDSARWSNVARFATSYSIPYLEVFGSETITSGEWNSYNQSFSGDSLNISKAITTDPGATKGWNSVSVPSGVTGMSDYVARAEVYSSAYDALLVSPAIWLPNLDASGDGEQLVLELKLARSKYAYSSSTSVSAPETTASHAFSVLVSLDGKVWKRSSGTKWASDGTGDYNYNDLVLKAKHYKINMSAYAGKKVYLGFFEESTASGQDDYLYIDSVSVKLVEPTCDGITKVEVIADSLSTHSVALFMSSFNSTDRIEYVYGVESVDLATAQPIKADSSVVCLSGLQPGTTYAVTARALCAQGDTSAWFKTVYFTTKCFVPVPVTYNFDDKSNRYDIPGLTGYYAKQMENCFEVVFNSNSYVPCIQDNTSTYTYSYSGTSALYMNMASSSYSNSYSIVAFPVLDADLDTLQLSFMARAGYAGTSSMNSSTGTYLHSVLVGTMDNLSDTTTFRLIKEVSLDPIESSSVPSTDATKFWRLQIVSLEGATGKYLVFMQRKGSKTNYIWIDDVVISKRLDCDPVENLRVDSVSTSSAIVRWTSSHNNFHVTLKSGAMEKVYENYTDTVLVLNDLTANTSYSVSVASVCGRDTTLALQVGFATLNGLPFAETFSPSFPSTWLRKSGRILEGGLLSSTSYGWTHTTANKYGIDAPKMIWDLTNEEYDYDYGYEYYEQNSILITPRVMLNARGTYPIMLSFDMALTSDFSSSAPSTYSTKDRKFAVLVSEDDGTTWTKIDSLIWGTDTTFTRRFDSIPSTATHYSFDFSAYRGKGIRVAFYAYSPANSASGLLHLTNVEIKEDNPNCVAPADLSVSDVTIASATIKWSGASTETYNVQVAKDAAYQILCVNSVCSDTTLSLNALQSNTKYYVRVRMLCDGDSYTNWVETSFLTPATLPFVEEFNSIATEFPASMARYKDLTLFTLLNRTDPLSLATAVSTGWGYHSSNQYALTDENHASVELYSTYSNYWMVTPTIDLTTVAPDANLMFSFDAALTFWNSGAEPKPGTTDKQKFYVVVSEDGGITWRKENLITWSNAISDSAQYKLVDIPSGAGQNYRFNFSKYVGKVVRIAFGTNVSSNDNRLHIDNIRLEETGSICLGVSVVTVDSTTATSAKLTIKDEEASQWQYAYGVSGFKLDSIEYHLVDTAVLALSNLRINTMYDVYVRSVCAVGDTSIWSGPFTFRTSFVPPIVETFDSIATKYPAYWSRYAGVSLATLLSTEHPFASANVETSQWGYNNSNIHALEDENHVSINICSGNTYNDKWLVSPSIDLSVVPADTSLLFSFDAALTQWNTAAAPTSSDNQSLYLIVSEDNGRTWQRKNLIIWSNTPADGVRYKLSDIPTQDGRNYSFDFTKYIGKQIQVAFGTYATANDNRLHIDNIRLEEIGSICTSVVGIQADTIGATRAVLSFSVEGKSAQWQYVYGLAGFNLTDTTPVNTIDTTSFVLSGLTTNTQYDVYVRTVCSEISTSAWTKYVLKTAYTLPLQEDFATVDTSYPADWQRYSAIDAADLFAGKKTFATQNTSSVGWVHSVSGAYAMEDDKHLTVSFSNYSKGAYWFVSPVVDATQVADTINLLLSFDLALTNSSSNETPGSTDYFQFYVLISADGGKTWAQQDALVWSDVASDNPYSLLSAVPNGAGTSYLLNLTRYAGKSLQIAFGATTNGMANWYDKADLRYHLDNIRLYADSSYCFEPETVEQVASTSSSITLKVVDANKKAKKWQYAYGKRGLALTDTVSVNTPIFTISELISGTQYDIYVRSICSATDTSAWVGPYICATGCALPYSEEFSTIAAEFPGLWKRYRNLAPADLLSGKVSFNSAEPATSGWGYDSRYNGNALEDANHVGVELYNSSSKSWLVSPAIELTGLGAEQKIAFSFDAALTHWNSNNPPESVETQRFYIMVSEDAGQTWNKENVLLWSDLASDSAKYHLSDILSGTGTNYLFDFTAYAGKTIQLAFGIEVSQKDNRLHLDNIRLYATESICASVSRPVKTDATASSLSLHISENNQAISWQYAYGASGFVLDSTVQCYTTLSRDIQLSNLSAKTTYDVYLRAVCAVGDTSAWAGPFAYRTDYTVPFVETFNKMATTYFPAYWTRYNYIQASKILSGDTLLSQASPLITSGTCNYWGYSSAYNKNAFSDENHISVQIDNAAQYQALMLTPTIDLGMLDPNAGLLFSFEAALTGWNTDYAPTSTTGQRFYVMVSDDAGKTWNSANAILWSDLASDAAQYSMASIPVSGKIYRFDFSKYVGKKIQIAFAVESSTSSARLHIDNIKLEESATTCYGVSNVKLKTAAASYLVFTFVPEDEATQWQYAACPSGTPLTDATPRYSTTLTQDTIKGLVTRTAYDVYVRSICGVGDTSEWAGPYTMMTSYAAPYKETFDNIASEFPQDWVTYQKIFTLNELLGGTRSFETETEIIPTGSTNYWGYSSSYNNKALADEAHIGVEIYKSYSAAWLLSPIVDMTDADASADWEFSFDAALTTWNTENAPALYATNDQLFCVAISEDGGDSYTEALVWSNDATRNPQYPLSDIPAAAGKNYAFDFSKYVGKKVRLAFGVEALSNDNRLHLDNISIHSLYTYKYTASTCNSGDYIDRYFTIPQSDMQIGETEYKVKIAGINNAPDTAVTLTLTVYPAENVVLYDTICQGSLYDRNGYNFTAQNSVVLPNRLTSVNGCDSLVELHLEVLPVKYADTTIMACQSYTYQGTTYYADKVFTDTLVSAVGCDSIVRVFLRISTTGDTETMWRTAICAGDTYSDELFSGLTEPGTYTASTKTPFGCDSTVTLNLLVADATKKAIYDTIAQAELPYIFEGETFLGANTRVGDYEHDVQSSCGQVTLYMHVYTETGLSSVEVGTLLLNPNPARVGEPIRIVSKFSSYDRYSVSVLSALGQTVFHSDTPVEYLPGMPQAGVYTVRVATDTQIYQAKLLVR